MEVSPYCDADQTFREKSTSLKSECRNSLRKQGEYFQVQWSKRNHRPDARKHRTEKVTFGNEHASTGRASTAPGTANTLRMGGLSTQNPCQVVAGRQNNVSCVFHSKNKRSRRNTRNEAIPDTVAYTIRVVSSKTTAAAVQIANVCSTPNKMTEKKKRASGTVMSYVNGDRPQGGKGEQRHDKRSATSLSRHCVRNVCAVTRVSQCLCCALCVCDTLE